MKNFRLFLRTLIGVCIFFLIFPVQVQGAADMLTFPKNEAFVPIIMYHLVTENGKYIGKYGIRPAELEADLKYLQDAGYETVLMADLINFVHHNGTLPAKPIVLTFDDGNTGDVNYVLPLLEKYDKRAVFSVIGQAADKYSPQAEKNPKAKYPNLTWAQIREMHLSGRCEIQSHGYDVHGRNGAGRNRGESSTAYHTRLLQDLQKLQKRCEEEIGFTPTTFTFPLGVISEGAQQILDEAGFAASLSCQEGMNRLTQGDAHCLFRLLRSNRPSGVPVKILLDKIEK
ncbi:MAG: polysaccharide deacetylase family protein [Defluviitaleaceae bacterium]|nr:polysaccharide deacetylase family protein [Defluviitaleaceae bacterium]MCL2189773.1 polysaccharide deacetylase family protein [Defluviitaleaceae bacterium]MCL2275405.1 polysaccharide deacetylase family protein [Defluviitaleaceae bacterium]